MKVRAPSWALGALLLLALQSSAEHVLVLSSDKMPSIQSEPTAAQDAMDRRPKRSGSGNILQVLGGASGGSSSGSPDKDSDAGGYPASDAGGYPTSDAGGYPASDAGGYSASDAGGYPAGDAGGYPASDASGYPAGDPGDAGLYPAGDGGGGSGSGLLGGKGILGSLLGSSNSNSAAGGGGKGFLSSLLGSSSSNPLAGGAVSAAPVSGKGPTYGNYIGTGAGLPLAYDHRSFDMTSFRKSLMGVLMQAMRAITGGVIALKGQLVRVKGQLLSTKGRIISASGDALSQFGRNVASNALRPTPPPAPAPPLRPVYGPPGYMNMLHVPRPMYGPPMYNAPLPLPPRPMYGVPAGHSHQPNFNVYSNTLNPHEPRYRQPSQSFPLGQLPPPPPPPPQPQRPPSPPLTITPSVETYSSHSISGALDSYGPPPAGPLQATSYSSSTVGSPLSHHDQPSSSFNSPGVLQDFSNFNLGSPGYAKPDSGYGVPDSTDQQSENYFRQNANHGGSSGPSTLNTLQGAHAGLLLLKPVQNAPQQATKYQFGQDSDQELQQLKNSQVSQYDLPTGSGYASQEYGARLGSNDDNNSKLSNKNDRTVNNNKNERTFSLLFGAKKPAPLRPHPVTRALPPQVVAAASAQLAAKLDLAGRAPPRTAVAVSGPHGKFIMYQ